MNLDHPHDLVEDILNVPKHRRARYRPIPPSAAAALRAMTPEQRAAWLEAHPLDVERIEKAKAKRERRARRRTA